VRRATRQRVLRSVLARGWVVALGGMDCTSLGSSTRLSCPVLAFAASDWVWPGAP